MDRIKSLLRQSFLAFIILSSAGCRSGYNEVFKKTDHQISPVPEPATAFNPKTYVCYTTDSLKIDGKIMEDYWQKAKWTNDFVDIEGDLKPSPLYKTRAKMLWDKEYFYIAAEISEPHIQAKLQQRDTVIFYDNDFEVFIDPDGDTHGYYELELNALNTVWDLLLTRPYRDTDSYALDAWDIKGLKSAVCIYGSLNNPSDIDKMWSVEIAIPLDVLSEWGNKPSEGTQWRLNFSRVNWKTTHLDGSYSKEINPETGNPFPEFNWVWSPQGLINMHYPEIWGFIQFTETRAGENNVDFVKNPDEELKWDLRKLYYAQRKYAAINGSYASLISRLNKQSDNPLNKSICIQLTPSGYEAYILSEYSGLTWIINQHGRIFSTKN